MIGWCHHYEVDPDVRFFGVRREPTADAMKVSLLHTLNSCDSLVFLSSSNDRHNQAGWFYESQLTCREKDEIVTSPSKRVLFADFDSHL